MRLIDADALEYTRVRIFHGLNEDGTPCVGGYNAVVMSCAIEDAPTVDAVPVVHGRWIYKQTEDEDWGHTFHSWECSNCNYHAECNPAGKNYCPHCGAKMDGNGEKEDNAR